MHIQKNVTDTAGGDRYYFLGAASRPSSMIKRYNLSQLTKAAFSLILGTLAVLLTFVFLRFAMSMLSWGFRLDWSGGLCDLLAMAGLALVGFSGYRTWRAKGGLHSYHESAFYHDMGEGVGSAEMLDYYAHRVTAPAHLLNQLFLAGPLRLLDAWTVWKSRLPESAELEGRLEKTLATLKAANKWQSISEYPALRTEILHLAQMELIDFSAYKGEPRIKSR